MSTAPFEDRSTQSSLDSVLRRLQVLEDERAVRETLHRYGHAIDHGLEATWVDLFLPDTYVEIRARHPPEGTKPLRPMTTHEDLARFISRHTRAPERWHQHLIANPVIELDGDDATVDSYFLVLLEEGDRRDVLCFGRYFDRLRRCSDGRWRFARRVMEVDSTSGALMGRPSGPLP